ncbi:putative lipoate regulatory protein YbeD [Candidatus Burkholderia brachyanthoides]|nr:putative lipoate regulatory protein YbeD [Candidatus Burkholderia brachyanthoides]
MSDESKPQAIDSTDAAKHSADELFDFPCDFPIKVMGKSDPGFQDVIVDVLKQHDKDFDASRVETRPSSGGNYTGLTCTVHAQNRAHLDDIYRALTGHPMVKVVL